LANPLGGGMSEFRVSVIIPARNEARNLPHVLEALPMGLHEVILVDGHSVDDTIEVARRLRPDVKIVQQTRRGKGNALACGFSALSGDIVVMLDADGSADPSEIPAFVAALADGADFAKGTRFHHGGDSHDITRFRKIGNAGLNRLVNLLFGTSYTDLCYGYNAFKTHLLSVLELPPTEVKADRNLSDGMLWGDGFEIETLINVRVARAGARIVEVGSTERARLNGVSNLKAIPDGLRVLHIILAERRRLNRVRDNAVVSPATEAVSSGQESHVAFVATGRLSDEVAWQHHRDVPEPVLASEGNQELIVNRPRSS
jgi:glycosyltransferase involved in cell wall biosynthesis